MNNNYEDFKKKVLLLSGIDLNAYKERQMKRRINSLITRNGHDNYEDYYKLINSDREKYDEFITFLTINVSEFYRNVKQWKVLENDVLPIITDNYSKKVKIWSAACSTGDEPYTIAMIMRKHYAISDISILATDIDKEILSKAKAGYYNEKSLDKIPSEFKSKYFKKDKEIYKVSDELKKCIDFKQHNLLEDVYPSNLDLIVCRNVLIYFTEETKNSIYKRFYKSLKKDGFLFVGSTEQIIQSQRYGFKSQESFFYKKEEL